MHESVLSEPYLIFSFGPVPQLRCACVQMSVWFFLSFDVNTDHRCGVCGGSG